MSVYNGNEINGLNKYINYTDLSLITNFESAEEKLFIWIFKKIMYMLMMLKKKYIVTPSKYYFEDISIRTF